jgi:uncharacterized Zn finger protein
MNMGITLPDCPHCGSEGEAHTEIVVIILPVKGPERTEFRCAVCGQYWSVSEAPVAPTIVH